MNECQACDHECHCEGNCNVEDCNCENCECTGDVEKVAGLEYD